MGDGINFSLEEMNEMYKDVLREIGNIGAGNATTALASLLGQKVDMSVPQVKLLEFDEIGELVGGEETVLAGIYLGVEGDIGGNMMFLLSIPSAKYLVSKLMMGMESPGEDFSEMERSALQEVGNIITGSYLNALASLTNMCIYPTVPDLNIDMAAALLSVPAIQYGALGDKILLIQTQFFGDKAIDGYFILIPDMDSYGKVLRALGILNSI